MAETLNVNQASAMAMVNTLEALGYVRRAQGKDKRSKALHITHDGRVAYDQACDAEHRLSDDLFGNLSGAERASLSKILNKIRQRALEISASSEAL